MTAFINIHDTFFGTLHWGEKMTFPFGFNITATSYDVVQTPMYGIGLADDSTDYCVSSFGQRHPRTGELLWVHRIGAKLSVPELYLDLDPVPRAWSHMVKIDAFVDEWYTHFHRVNERVILPGLLHGGCMHPHPILALRPVPKEVWDDAIIVNILISRPCRSLRLRMHAFRRCGS